MQFLDIILHLDKYLAGVIGDYGQLTYLLLFVIIFMETGLVVTPFLPGDSLLFAVGSLAGLGMLDIRLVLLTLMAAAVLGDSVNYLVGSRAANFLLLGPGGRLVNRKHLERTQEYYATHGGKTVIVGRFIPIIRTFAPFVAGLADMGYPRFLAFSVTGTVLWVGGLTLAGYFFGSLPVVKNNFSVVVYSIVAVSLLPVAVEFFRARRRGRPA